MIKYSKFKELLDSKGLSSYAISKATGISQSVLSDWKNGKSTPKLDKLKILSEYFGVSPSYFDDNDWVELKQIRDLESWINNKPGGLMDDTIKDSEVKSKPAYYFDPETARVAQEVYDNPDLRILFDAARDAKPQDIKMAADLLQRFKETNPDA